MREYALSSGRVVDLWAAQDIRSATLILAIVIEQVKILVLMPVRRWITFDREVLVPIGCQ